MRRRRQTPEGARLNAKQYALAFRDRPETLARTEAFLRNMVRLSERSLAIWQTHKRDFYEAAGSGERWSITYNVRKAEQQLASYRAQLEGHLEGAKT